MTLLKTLRIVREALSSWELVLAGNLVYKDYNVVADLTSWGCLDSTGEEGTGMQCLVCLAGARYLVNNWEPIPSDSSGQTISHLLTDIEFFLDYLRRCRTRESVERDFLHGIRGEHRGDTYLSSILPFLPVKFELTHDRNEDVIAYLKLILENALNAQLGK